MGILEMLLWLLGGLAAIILLCVGVLWVERNFPGEQYDERQQIARGKAYRMGYWIGALCLFVCILYITLGGDTDGMLLVIFLGFMAQTIGFHVYCLLTHAALPLSKKPVSTIVSYGVLAVCEVVYFLLARDMDARWEDKPPVMTWAYLSMAVGFGALCIMHLIQYLRDRKE